MFKQLRKIFSRWHKTKAATASHETPQTNAHEPQTVEALDDVLACDSPGADDVESLVSQMLAHNRYGLLLREQIAQNLTPEHYETAKQSLNEAMSLVPTGNVYMEPGLFDIDYAALALQNPDKPGEFTVTVQSVYLDRYLVTNPAVSTIRQCRRL